MLFLEMYFITKVKPINSEIRNTINTLIVMRHYTVKNNIITMLEKEIIAKNKRTRSFLITFFYDSSPLFNSSFNNAVIQRRIKR